jgi:sulfate transporter 4
MLYKCRPKKKLFVIISHILLQIAIANPNRQVHLLLSTSGLIDLIGKEWYFVRVHDAVQVCLQHVQNVTGKTSGSSSNDQTMPKRPSGLKQDSVSELPPMLEPLLRDHIV